MGVVGPKKALVGVDVVLVVDVRPRMWNGGKGLEIPITAPALADCWLCLRFGAGPTNWNEADLPEPGVGKDCFLP